MHIRIIKVKSLCKNRYNGRKWYINHIKIKNKEQYLKYDVKVITEFLSKKFIIEIDELCKQSKIGLIFAFELGIYGFFL
jgi:hypothetical protein